MSASRPLRVLHLGNIANNAYNNAKLLREAGVDCDVLCPLYYHTMACPEWEDADFEEPVDDYRPAWHRVGLGGFERQDWFAQGPMLLSIRYLLARRRGHRGRLAVYGWLMKLNLRLRAGWLGRLDDRLREIVVENGGPVRVRHLSQADRAQLVKVAMASFVRASVILASGLAALALAGVQVLRGQRPVRELAGKPSKDTEDSLEALVREFGRRFPDRPDPLTVEDLTFHLRDSRLLGELFAEYDVVQAYSTDPIFPVLAGYRPIVAFEHGTLREIPFEENRRGRCTSLAYALADHVLVTNPDCQGPAESLNPGRVTMINHPWDEDHALGVKGAEALREELLGALDADHLIFFPTRHDWVPGTGYADKANDRFFRALSRWTQKTGARVGVVCCEWGKNVAQSRALIEELGMTRHVRWSAAMGTVRFERFVLASDLVADQFDIAGMGGVAFKSLSAGRPVLMRIDEDVMREKYGEVPPALNCHTEEEIVRVLDTLLEPREVWQRRCDDARNWIKKHHAGADVVGKQLAIYSELTDARPASGALS